VGQETAGEPGAKWELENEIGGLGLADHVHLAGHLSDVERAVASFDLLLMPSPAETFGRVVIEAMACGVPVAAAAGGGVPGIIQNGANGVLFEPMNVPAMTAALKDLCLNGEKRARIAAAGLRSVERDYDSDVVARKLFQLLKL
jgi:glycosyltransferase involved in cell wall biosynthesis